MTHRLHTGAAALLVLAGAAPAQELRMLETLGGATSVASDVNDQGQIVGYSTGPLGNATIATIWNAGIASGLGSAPGTDFSYATAINDGGDVVGYSETGSIPGEGSNANTATWWGRTGTTIDIGASMGRTYSRAFDVNESGNVAMQGDTVRGTGGYVWNASLGGVQAGADPIYNFGGNNGINDANNLAGWAQAGFDGGQAIFTTFNGAGWDVGVEIGPQAVIEPSWANAISDTNILVGRAGDGRDHTSEAARFTLDPRDPVEWLGKLAGHELSEAHDVNDIGLIVGSSAGFGAAGFEERAVAWLDGAIFDLNDLVEPGSDWALLVRATGVNDHGDIVGWGFQRDGTTKGFLIEGYVPAPGASLVLGMGGLLATRRRR